MKAVRGLIAALLILAGATPARADLTGAQLAALAGTLAAEMAQACPHAAPGDVGAFTACAAALRGADPLAFAPDGMLWGGDQPGLRLRKKQLTHFSANVFSEMYLPLFSFTGRWTTRHDDREGFDIIDVEAYFRNALPPGEYPYPFWHSADKWSAYETANRLSFYLDPDGKILAITRSANGSEAARGAYAHVTPPAFDGNWQWLDASGKPQPEASLFTSRFSSANPFLAKLDQSYRAFATELRQGTCMSCHTPDNRAGMDRLVLLQSPRHAAGEIDDALKAVRNRDMPQTRTGSRRALEPSVRAAILSAGEAFRDVLGAASAWEAAQKRGS